MAQPNPPQPVQATIQARPEVAAGVYANLARGHTSSYEITVDFVHMDFSTNQGILVSRVAMSPMLAQQLLSVLQTQIEAYASNAIEQEVGSGIADGPATDQDDGDPGQ